MFDKELKQEIVRNDLDKITRRLDYLDYLDNNGQVLDEHEKQEFEQFKLIYNTLSEDEKRVIYNLNIARWRRIKRTRHFINKLFCLAVLTNSTCAFVTLTFNDNTLNTTTELARRKRVRRFLDRVCLGYFANIDFGKTNEREHYHAILVLKNDFDKELFNYWEQKNGFYNIKPISCNDDLTNVKLSKYLNKLTYHALKDTTQHEDTSYRAIYKINKPFSDIIQ